MNGEYEGIANNWDHPLYLRCECHQPHHAVIVEPDRDIDGTVNVSVISAKSGSLWHRVKYALRHIFVGERLIEADLILGEDAVARLRDFCTTVIERKKQGGNHA